MTDERSAESAPADDRPIPDLASRAAMIRRWNHGSLLIVHTAQEKVSDERLMPERKDDDAPGG